MTVPRIVVTVTRDYIVLLLWIRSYVIKFRMIYGRVSSEFTVNIIFFYFLTNVIGQINSCKKYIFYNNYISMWMYSIAVGINSIIVCALLYYMNRTVSCVGDTSKNIIIAYRNLWELRLLREVQLYYHYVIFTRVFQKKKKKN